MAGVRLVVDFTADTAEIANSAVAAMAERCKKAQQEPGCKQFEVFRSALDATRYVLLEVWESKEALAVHASLNAANPRPPTPGVKSVREDYEYQAT